MSYELGPNAIRQTAEMYHWYYFAGRQNANYDQFPTPQDRGPWLAKADAFIAQNTAGDFSIYHGSTMGSETDVGRTVKATMRLTGVGTSQWCMIFLMDGKLEAIKMNIRRLGKTDAAINAGASGTVSIYGGGTAGSETDTTENVTAYNRFGNVASGKWVYVFQGENTWELEEAQCA